MRTHLSTKIIISFLIAAEVIICSAALKAQTLKKVLPINKDVVSNFLLSDDTPPVLDAVKHQITSESGVITKSPANIKSMIITIIESQSINSSHNMDINWYNIATAMGHMAVILPQTTLDDTDFFANTDLLMVSSGIIDIPQSRRAIIQQFLETGKPVYLQSEYLSSYQANQTFQELVNNLGGSFTWGSTFSNNLSPMNLSGAISNTPNNVPALTYFWWGCSGSGDTTIESNMEYEGSYFGFIFTPPNGNYGILMTNSDQDWAREAPERDQLMENILTYFSSLQTGINYPNSDASPDNYFLEQNFPNPFNPTTKISFSIPKLSSVTLKVYDVLGNEIETLVNEEKPVGTYELTWNAANLPSGVYFYQIRADNFIQTKKMILLK
jgi:hypothetical protein